MKRVVGLALALLLLGALWFAGLPAYRSAKEKRAIKLAMRFAQSGDLRTASLSARRALALNPQSLPACRLMAEIALRAHAPQALDWQQRLVELSPTLENRLALAQTAMRVEPPPYALATETLDSLRPTATNAVAFQLLSAELALKLRRYAQAEACLGAAAALEPTNELHRLNLATVRLLSTNPVTAARARASLEEFAVRPSLPALRSLIADSLSHSNPAVAETFSTRLLSMHGVGFEDRLQHLIILHTLGRPGFEASLTALQNSAQTNPAALYTLASWMSTQGLAGTALQWLTNCAPAVQAAMPVPLAIAAALNACQDWPGLERFLQQQQTWGDLDFSRLAWLARAADAQNNREVAQARWRLALQHADGRLGPLISLLPLAQSLKNPAAHLELLWRIVQQFPRERWPVQTLAQLYTRDGNTHGLYKLWDWVATNNPRDFESRNNLAALCLLLKLNLPKAHQWAEENYRERSGDPIIAATYGFSLHLQGRNAEGLAVFRTLSPAQLRAPAVGLYYGLLLAGNGLTGEAAAALDTARQTALLPEEKQLLVHALPTE